MVETKQRRMHETNVLCILIVLLLRTMNTAFAVSKSTSLLIMFAPRSNRSRSRIKLVVFDKTLSTYYITADSAGSHSLTIHLNLY